MGTEQQQELKPEKQTTKQRRKYIPFTDLSIKNWKPKKPICFTDCQLLGSFQILFSFSLSVMLGFLIHKPFSLVCSLTI